MAAMISAPLALGARAAVRGAKVQQKEANSVNVVRSSVRADMTKGEFDNETSRDVMRRIAGDIS